MAAITKKKEPVQQDALLLIAPTPAEALAECPCPHCDGQGHYQECQDFNQTLQKIVCERCTFETSAMVFGFDETLLRRWQAGSITRTPVLRMIKERANHQAPTKFKCDAFIWRAFTNETRFLLANLAQLSPDKVALLELTREQYNSGKLTLTATDFNGLTNAVSFDSEPELAQFTLQLISKKTDEPDEQPQLPADDNPIAEAIEIIAIPESAEYEIAELDELAILASFYKTTLALPNYSNPVVSQKGKPP